MTHMESAKFFNDEIKGLWSNWNPKDAEGDLWIDVLMRWPRDIAYRAIQKHKLDDDMSVPKIKRFKQYAFQSYINSPEYKKKKQLDKLRREPSCVFTIVCIREGRKIRYPHFAGLLILPENVNPEMESRIMFDAQNKLENHRQQMEREGDDWFIEKSWLQNKLPVESELQQIASTIDKQIENTQEQEYIPF